jgi:hypothetical protein
LPYTTTQETEMCERALCLGRRAVLSGRFFRSGGRRRPPVSLERIRPLRTDGPPRIVDPRKSPEVADFWNYGDPFETYPIDTARGSGALSS